MSDKKKIIVIDDDEALAKIVSKAFLKAGFEVLAFNSAEGALEKLDEFKPHLIITDIMMPGMAGPVFCRKASKKRYEQASGEVCRVYVFVMSALADKKSEVNARSCGAVEYFGKPFALSQILETARRYLNDDKDIISWSESRKA